MPARQFPSREYACARAARPGREIGDGEGPLDWRIAKTTARPEAQPGKRSIYRPREQRYSKAPNCRQPKDLGAAGAEGKKPD